MLNTDPRVPFIPFDCHLLNFVAGHAATFSRSISVLCLEYLQKIYEFFSASYKRCGIFPKYVLSLAVKHLSNTRWECRIHSVKAIRLYLNVIQMSCSTTQSVFISKSINTIRNFNNVSDLV